MTTRVKKSGGMIITKYITTYSGLYPMNVPNSFVDLVFTPDGNWMSLDSGNFIGQERVIEVRGRTRQNDDYDDPLFHLVTTMQNSRYEPDAPESTPAVKDMNDPNTYKRSCVDETRNNCIEDIYKSWDNLIPEADMDRYEAFTLRLIELNPTTAKELEKAMRKLCKEFKFLPKKSQLGHMYAILLRRPELELELKPVFRQLLVKKAQKSQSGVLVITVLTSPYPQVSGKKPQKFSCQWNCYYCPNEPGQPRSYLHDEPSVLRANRNDFDPVLQFCDRAVTLAMNGHPVDKIELLILGGTWASYPVDYQEEFIRDLFYAANTFFDRPKRARKSLADEKFENESSAVKIIGLTLETRPDCINKEELIRFRKFGCTRVQLGIQHTDDVVLTKINRGCTNADAIRAIRLLRDTGYKMDIHLMPNLPGSTPEKDIEMFEYVLHSPDVQADQWKIYPCEITPWTVIKKWYESGDFVPYGDNELMRVLMHVKKQVHPWIRLNRVIRDIPSQYILGGVDEPNLRQVILKNMAANGTPCRCIRCREIRDQREVLDTCELVIREFEASKGHEYFLSYESPDRRVICAFLRLRISSNPGAGIFPELEHAGLVRELHVYGQMIASTEKQKVVGDDNGDQVQHVGLGTKLMQEAERIARGHGLKKLAVISGVGVRNYYRKMGYTLAPGLGEMMIKELTPDTTFSFVADVVSNVVDEFTSLAAGFFRSENTKTLSDEKTKRTFVLSQDRTTVVATVTSLVAGLAWMLWMNGRRH